MARCLALQWYAKSSRAEISAASPGYQRETSFVNSSPTVSRLHSWLTALRVPLPCLRTASKALVAPRLTSSASQRSLLQLTAALVLAIKDVGELISCGHIMHKWTPKHVEISDPLAFEGHYSTQHPRHRL